MHMDVSAGTHMHSFKHKQTCIRTYTQSDESTHAGIQTLTQTYMLARTRAHTHTHISPPPPHTHTHPHIHTQPCMHTHTQRIQINIHAYTYWMNTFASMGLFALHWKHWIVNGHWCYIHMISISQITARTKRFQWYTEKKACISLFGFFFNLKERKKTQKGMWEGERWEGGASWAC